MLPAAIDTVAGIRPLEARAILLDLADSGDEEIAEAADEAIAIAEGSSGEIDDMCRIQKWFDTLRDPTPEIVYINKEVLIMRKMFTLVLLGTALGTARFG